MIARYPRRSVVHQAERKPITSRRLASLQGPELAWWHKMALTIFHERGDTTRIAHVLRTTEADAYTLLAQAREAVRVNG
jgi:hypothetical protein